MRQLQIRLFFQQQSLPKMSLNGKVILITGAASGIGAETARHLAQLGAKLSLIDLNETQLNEVADGIAASGAFNPLRIVADITKDAERIINKTLEHFGQLDVLINNAGIAGRYDSVIDFDVREFDRIMDVNLRSMIVLTNLAVPHLEKTKGNIVNVSSVYGFAAIENFMSYCISKAGVNQFTKCSAVALARKEIRVNAVNPGITRSAIYDAFGESLEDAFEKFKSEYLVKRLGEPSDIAAGITFLATQPYVNGITLPIDGGFLC